MKRTKRIFAIFMTLALAMSMLIVSSAVSFAADGETTATKYTITINKNSTDKAAHTYGAYQIFKGDLSEKTEGTTTTKTLSNIAWGDNVDTTKVADLITELNKIDGVTIKAGASAADIAEAIGKANMTADGTKAQAVADAFNKVLKDTPAPKTGTVAADATSGTIANVDAGYYLVKDTADVAGQGAQTRFILQVVSNVTVDEKADIPSVEKKVKEKNDTTGTETGWQDAADYDIGDPIPYKLEGTLPGKFAEFDTYKTYTFVDTLSEGLAPPEADKVTVKVGTTDVTSHFDVTVEGQVLTVALKANEDLKAWTEPALTKDSTIVVEYNATLNNKAKIGSEGNPNEVYLKFSNNPNYDGDGDFGTTPEDKVIVFTYEIKANKVKEDETTALEGAGFTLFKKNNAGGYDQIGDEITGVTTFEFKGTDAGEYKLVETTVPAGYNKAEDITFTVNATYDTEAKDPKLKTLTVEPASAGFTVTTTAIEGDAEHITTDGVISGKVVNKSGATLPSTGGIGTVIFYVLGSLLVVGCGIVLVSKRRMENR